MYKKISKVCFSRSFERMVILAVFLNAILLGVEVSLDPASPWFDACKVVDRFFIGFFCGEILLKLMVYRWKYFSDNWRNFDFFVVVLSLIPNSGPLSILRSLRVLRALRMVSVIPRLRQVVSGLLSSIPSLGAVGGILLLIFYVAAVIATAIFGKSYPEWFGSLLKSSYSLFQIMTLESWSMGIVRPIMGQYSWAALFFVPFIIVTTFIMLNMMIAVIVNSMQVETSEAAEQHAMQGQDERAILLEEVRKIGEKVDLLETHLSSQNIVSPMKPPAHPESTHQTQ